MPRLSGWIITLSAIAIAAVACTSGSPGADPTSTPTTEAAPRTGTSSTPTPIAAGDIDPELAAFLQEVDRRMAEIRGIPVADPVPFRFLDSAGINAYVREQIDEPETVEDIENTEAIYRLLGLIEANAVLFDQYTALLDAQVLGAYDPEDEEFVVLQRGEVFGPSQEFTYAHEYVHRLQDARFEIDKIVDSLEGNSDRSLAFSALIEGDATTAQQIYALQHLDLEQLSQILAESRNAASQTPQDTPYILQRGLEFPYIEGASFVDRLRATQGAAAVDAAFDDLPDSTEQILHIEKFVNRELPIETALPEDLFASDGPVGSGWELIEEDVMGEFFLKSWLEAIGARSGDAEEAAAGWGGDVLALAEDSDGGRALAAKIEWDDPAVDAEQFLLVLTTIMGASPDFRRVDIGADVGVKAYRSDGGVIVSAMFSDLDSGAPFTAIAAATELQDAMALVLALAG